MPAAIQNFSATSVITDPTGIIGYVLRHYIASPKSMTDTFHEQAASLMDTWSRYGQQRSQIPDQVTSDLTPIFGRYFPNSATIINVTTEDVDVAAGRYSVVIVVSVTVDDVVYMVDKRAVIVNGQISLPTDSLNN